jgi:hypothetical protein
MSSKGEQMFDTNEEAKFQEALAGLAAEGQIVPEGRARVILEQFKQDALDRAVRVYKDLQRAAVACEARIGARAWCERSGDLQADGRRLCAKHRRSAIA